MSSEANQVSEETFLNSNLAHFRYEKSGRPNEFRLFHCEPGGTNRFSLYFGQLQKANEAPWELQVSLSNVNVQPHKIMVQASITMATQNVIYAPPKDSDERERILTQKICDILNRHQVYQSVGPD
jgi:hypothetical protein